MKVFRQSRAASLHWTVWIAALVSTSALLGACSGANNDHLRQQSQQAALTHEQYQQAILEILSSDDTRAATRLFSDTVATEYDREQCSERVRAFHEHLRSIIRRVEELRPPPDADDGQREFLDAAQESVRLVGVAADDVGKGELKCGMPLNSRIYGMPSTERAQAALSKLEKRGYVIFGS